MIEFIIKAAAAIAILTLLALSMGDTDYEQGPPPCYQGECYETTDKK